MITINLKSRFRNKAFIVAFISAVVLLIQQCGFKYLIPSNYADIVNTLLTIGTMLGIIVDTSTPGISDQVVSNMTVQAINTSNSQSVSNVQASSASAKNTPDNPDNMQSIGATVNAVSAVSPSAN